MKEVALLKKSHESLKRSSSSSTQENKTSSLSSPLPRRDVPPPLPVGRPEDSVYFHPKYNPSGAPPPGKQPMFRPPNSIPPSLAFGGMNGIPPPPPRCGPRGVVFGGTHGIPLPPPPRPFHPPIQTTALPSPQPRAKVKQTHTQRDMEDPLDPTSRGYTERFSTSQAEKKKEVQSLKGSSVHFQEGAISEADNITSSEVAEVVRDMPAVESLHNAIGIDSSRVDHDNDDNDDEEVSDGNDLVDESLQPAASGSNVGFNMDFDIEALMRRRMEVQEEAAPVTIERPQNADVYVTSVDENAALVHPALASARSALSSLLGGYGSDSDCESTEDAVAKELMGSEGGKIVEREDTSEGYAEPTHRQLKTIVPDPLLTTFVPIALRRKRPLASQVSDQQPKSMKGEEFAQKLAAPTVIRNIQAEVTTSSLDDEYNSFLSELNNLPNS